MLLQPPSGKQSHGLPSVPSRLLENRRAAEPAEAPQERLRMTAFKSRPAKPPAGLKAPGVYANEPPPGPEVILKRVEDLPQWSREGQMPPWWTPLPRQADASRPASIDDASGGEDVPRSSRASMREKQRQKELLAIQMRAKEHMLQRLRESAQTKKGRDEVSKTAKVVPQPTPHRALASPLLQPAPKHQVAERTLKRPREPEPLGEDPLERKLREQKQKVANLLLKRQRGS
mmetsp:Transcript_16745/g.38702  ORF Transcript_16745/g.38702 Transcript_16745/m.38702 type:complete len:231 (+) Transcript_16745:80-772(+)